MSQLPLLVFPKPDNATRIKKRFHKPKLQPWSSTQQYDRLTPYFKTLQNAIEGETIRIQESTLGIEPEMTLVFELACPIENFIKALRKIPGFEFLAEDEEFEEDYDTSTEEDDIIAELKSDPNYTSGICYLVMTNKTALEQLLSLWEKWNKDSNTTFNRGLAPFKHVFGYLKKIRPWDVEDRLEDTGIIEAWQEDLEHGELSTLKCEVELWYRDSEKKRAESSNEIHRLIRSIGGEVIQETLIQQIEYHAILVSIPVEAIKIIIANRNTELVKCNKVMFFRPKGQFSTDVDHLEEITISKLDPSIPNQDNDPIVALLDGLPLVNHSSLQGRLKLDDPDDLSSEYTLNNRFHGTAMASIVIHGYMDNNSSPLTTQLYVRPIMTPENVTINNMEGISDSQLIVDLIHRCVRRMYEGDAKNAPSAKSVRIINFSIGDRNRPFMHSMSPLARLLDWLTMMYDVLFIVSAGNHHGNFILELDDNTLYEHLDDSKRRSLLIQALYNDARNRRLLSPAESINCITVGALHDDKCNDFTIHDRTFNPYVHKLPCLTSAMGPGYLKSIKPDVVVSGGRDLYHDPMTAQGKKIERVINSKIGIKVACPSPTGGDLNRYTYQRGSSNSAALLSHYSEKCYLLIKDILTRNLTDPHEIRKSTIPLLKAMLIHGCSWGDAVKVKPC